MRGVRAGDGLLDAERARQRQPEHAQPIGHADAQMDAERRGRHEPAVEAGSSDGALAIEQPARLRSVPVRASMAVIVSLPCHPLSESRLRFARSATRRTHCRPAGEASKLP